MKLLAILSGRASASQTTSRYRPSPSIIRNTIPKRPKGDKYGGGLSANITDHDEGTDE